MNLIQQIKNLENTFEYTPKDDCFGRGWDKAKEEIIKMVEGKNMKYKNSRKQVATFMRTTLKYVEDDNTKKNIKSDIKELLATKPKTKSKCKHDMKSDELGNLKCSLCGKDFGSLIKTKPQLKDIEISWKKGDWKETERFDVIEFRARLCGDLLAELVDRVNLLSKLVNEK